MSVRCSRVMSMSNSIAMPSVVISPAMDSMMDSVNRLNAYARSVTQSMKLITESPTVNAFLALGKKHQEHTRILRELVKNPRFKMEMQLFRKQKRGNGLFALLHKVIERVLFLISRIRTAINVKTHPENKSGRARMMGLRGLALSCAPNAKRVSDMYLSMVATRRLA
jgi:hypothetical protein